jgi:hypothetical protein
MQGAINLLTLRNSQASPYMTSFGSSNLTSASTTSNEIRYLKGRHLCCATDTVNTMKLCETLEFAKTHIFSMTIDFPVRHLQEFRGTSKCFETQWNLFAGSAQTEQRVLLSKCNVAPRSKVNNKANETKYAMGGQVLLCLLNQRAHDTDLAQ